jgi:hypothetical protein
VFNRFSMFCLIGVLVALPGRLSAQEPAAGPQMVFETETVQMGQVVRGEVVEAEFVYRNEGDAPLNILRAKPG